MGYICTSCGNTKTFKGTRTIQDYENIIVDGEGNIQDSDTYDGEEESREIDTCNECEDDGSVEWTEDEEDLDIWIEKK